jgi:hypothetical protein
MPIDHLLKVKDQYDIQIFDEKQDINRLKTTHACFTGSPKKHPAREDKIILATNLFGTQPTYYEFNLTDISYVEKMSNEVALDGETLTIARIWVKKGSVGIHCIPFVVENISPSNIL